MLQKFNSLFDETPVDYITKISDEPQSQVINVYRSESWQLTERKMGFICQVILCKPHPLRELLISLQKVLQLADKASTRPF